MNGKQIVKARKQIVKAICTLFFVVYGLMGVFGRGPFSPNAVLATYMIIYFGHVYGVFDIRSKKEEE